MSKIFGFGLKDRTIPGCENLAGTGDFIAPTFDDTDICSSLESFFLAVNSYHDAYVCLDGLDLDGRTATQKQLRPIRIKNKIGRERVRLYTRKLIDFSCTATSDFIV